MPCYSKQPVLTVGSSSSLWRSAGSRDGWQVVRNAFRFGRKVTWVWGGWEGNGRHGGGGGIRGRPRAPRWRQIGGGMES